MTWHRPWAQQASSLIFGRILVGDQHRQHGSTQLFSSTILAIHFNQQLGLQESFNKWFNIAETSKQNMRSLRSTTTCLIDAHDAPSKGVISIRCTLTRWNQHQGHGEQKHWVHQGHREQIIHRRQVHWKHRLGQRQQLSTLSTSRRLTSSSSSSFEESGANSRIRSWHLCDQHWNQTTQQHHLHSFYQERVQQKVQTNCEIDSSNKQHQKTSTTTSRQRNSSGKGVHQKNMNIKTFLGNIVVKLVDAGQNSQVLTSVQPPVLGTIQRLNNKKLDSKKNSKYNKYIKRGQVQQVHQERPSATNASTEHIARGQVQQVHQQRTTSASTEHIERGQVQQGHRQRSSSSNSSRWLLSATKRRIQQQHRFRKRSSRTIPTKTSMINIEDNINEKKHEQLWG